MAEPSASESSADSDQDFDPTAEMLVNDFDDEHTLEEEEALESAESVTNELDDLQREGEMPLEELIAIYGCVDRDGTASPNKHSSSNTESPLQPDVTSDKEENAEVPMSQCSDREESPLEIPENPSGPLLRSVSQASDSSESGTDEDYSPDDDWRKVDNNKCKEVNCSPIHKDKTESIKNKLSRCLHRASQQKELPEEFINSTKPLYPRLYGRLKINKEARPMSPVVSTENSPTIQVGSDYQAVVPEGLCKYDDAPAYENEDRLLWDPSILSDDSVVEYLRQAQQPFSGCAQGVNAIPVGNHSRDDEQALYLLLQCGHNVEEALRRRRMLPLPPADTMSLWSEEECRSFENGLRTYGKDFHLIQQNKVRTRSVGEIVQFYYLWKKTERHDVLASKNRLEKKKYALHPGTTDYMDRFLDEQENPSTHRDRSSSPSMHSLIYGDSKKQQCIRSSTSSPTANHSKGDSFPDVGPQGEPLHPAEALPFISDIGYANVDREVRVRPIDNRSHSELTGPLIDSGREYVNGSSNMLNTDKPHNFSNLHIECVTTNDRNPTCNTSTDIMSCMRHPMEAARFHETRPDNQRFESRREEVASME